MHFGPNLEILTSIGGDLRRGKSCKQAQNGVNIYFEVKFDLEVQGQSPSKTIGILTKVFYTFGPNLAIVASLNVYRLIVCTSKWLTHRLTHTQTQAMTIPKGQNWPRVTRVGWAACCGVYSGVCHIKLGRLAMAMIWKMIYMVASIYWVTIATNFSKISIEI